MVYDFFFISFFRKQLLRSVSSFVVEIKKNALEREKPQNAKKNGIKKKKTS